MIFAIDPGNTQSGFVLLGTGAVIDSGVLPNDDMQARIDHFFYDEVPGRGFYRVAIEQIRNMGMIVGQEVFDTVFWTGRFYERCASQWHLSLIHI